MTSLTFHIWTRNGMLMMGQLIESTWAAGLWFGHHLDRLLIVCCSFITKMKASGIFFPFLRSQMRTRWSRWAIHVNFVWFQVVKCVRRLKWCCSRVVEMHTPKRNVDGSADTIHGVFCLFSLWQCAHMRYSAACGCGWWFPWRPCSSCCNSKQLSLFILP